MYIEKTKVNQSFINKANRKLYVCVEVGDGYAVLNEAQRDPETEEIRILEGVNPVRVEKPNDICYQLDDDPNPPREYTVDDFSIDNGVIVVDDNPVIMGDIKADQLLTVVKGRYLCFIGSKDGAKAIFTYSPKKDSFIQQTSLTEEYSVNPVDDLIVILASEKRTVKEDDVERTVSDGSTVIICSSESVRKFDTDELYIDPATPDIKVVDGSVYVGTGYFLDDYNNIIQDGYRYLAVGNGRNIIETDNIADIYPSFRYGNILMTAEAIIRKGRKYTVSTEKLGKYIYLVDLKEESPTKDVLTFADAEGSGIRVLTYDYRDDRGVVYDIQ